MNKRILNKKITNLIMNSKSLSTKTEYIADIIRNKHIPSFTESPPRPTYIGRHLVTMLPGIGTGQKMMEYVREVYRQAHVPVDFEFIDDIGATEAIITSIKRNGAAIKGHIPELPNTASNVALRSQIDLYVYQVHCRSYPNIRSRMSNIDIIVFRQNTEGEYAMLEHEPKPGIVESLKIITRHNTIRFAKWAYDFARRNGRKKITIVHKANIMKVTDGLFLKTIKGVGKSYPDIKTQDLIVDNACMQIVSKPHDFDVILTPNLYGNIIISIICGLIGGHGIISGQNFSDYCGVFEVGLRHVAFADKTFFNPVAMLNASVNLLYYLKKDEHATIISQAIYKALVEDKVHTPDIGGKNTCDEVVDAIKKHIKYVARKQN